MSLKGITGHKNSINILINAFRNQKLHHSYLFTGPEGVGKYYTAVQFAKLLICEQPIVDLPESCDKCKNCNLFNKKIHPDVFLISPEPGKINIGVDTIRDLQTNLIHKSHLAKYKIAIINDSHTLSVEAQNAFLKTIEEPPDNSFVFLITHKVHTLLPTVISRCQKINFSLLSKDDILSILKKSQNYNEEYFDLLAEISTGSITKANYFIENDLGKTIELVKKLFNSIYSTPADVISVISELSELELKKDQLKIIGELLIVFYHIILLKKIGKYPENSQLGKIINIDLLENRFNIETLMGSIQMVNNLIQNLEGTTNWRFLFENFMLNMQCKV